MLENTKIYPLWKFFTKIKLAIFLILILAVISGLNTIYPKIIEDTLSFGKENLESEIYHSWWYITVQILLFINILICSIERLPQNLKITRRKTDILLLTKETVNSMPVKYEFTSNDISDSCKNENIDEKFNNILEYLRKKNYDIINKSGISGVKESASLSDGNWFFAEKGKIRYWGSYLTHFGILLFITGYITGKVFGFLGTVYIYNDTDINYCYNWYEKKDKLFDFKVYLENLDIIFYPVKAKLEIISLNDNRRIIQNINENEKVYLEIGNYPVILEFSGFIPDAMVKDGMVYQISKVAANPCFIFKIYDKNKNFLFTHFLFLDKSYVNSLENLGFRLEVKKYKAVESEIKGDLIFLNNEQILKRETLKINKPVNFKGKNFYLVTYGQDEFKNTRIGLQITEDPGIYIIWSSFIFMLSGIIISFFIYHIKIYTYKDNNSIIIGGICGKSNYIVEKELKKIKKEIEND